MGTELLTNEIMTDLETARDDIAVFDWTNARRYGRLKNGESFACPVIANFGADDFTPDEVGIYKGTLIIEIRENCLDDYSVGDWDRIDEDELIELIRLNLEPENAGGFYCWPRESQIDFATKCIETGILPRCIKALRGVEVS